MILESNVVILTAYEHCASSTSSVLTLNNKSITFELWINPLKMFVIFNYTANVRYVRDATDLLHFDGLYFISQEFE